MIKGGNPPYPVFALMMIMMAKRQLPVEVWTVMTMMGMFTMEQWKSVMERTPIAMGQLTFREN